MDSPSSSRLSKEVWVGWISSLAEAYNIAIYSFVAPLLAILLFQGAADGRAVFFSYSLVFIASSLMYPLGAIYYGLIGDQRGRQKACIYSTLGLAIATGLLGLIPIHFLGNSAWICFLICICAQYFFSGGEYHGSIVFSLEHAESQQKGCMSAFSCLFAVFGLVAANGLATLAFVMDDLFWVRICFFVGAMSGLLSYLLKNYCRETPAFMAISSEALTKVCWRDFLRTHWRKIGIVIAVWAFFIVSYSFIFIFLPLVVPAHHDFDTFKSLMAYGGLLVMSGFLADWIGTQNIMLWGLRLFSISVVPLFYFFDDLLLLQLVLAACACLVIGPIHSWMLHQFEAKHRCRGIFLCSAIATSVFGGSTVPLCLMIFDYTHSLVACSFYPFSIALFAAYYLQRSLSFQSNTSYNKEVQRDEPLKG